MGRNQPGAPPPSHPKGPLMTDADALLTTVARRTRGECACTGECGRNAHANETCQRQPDTRHAAPADPRANSLDAATAECGFAGVAVRTVPHRAGPPRGPAGGETARD